VRKWQAIVIGIARNRSLSVSIPPEFEENKSHPVSRMAVQESGNVVLPGYFLELLGINVEVGVDMLDVVVVLQSFE